jgi:hypothetical protein
MAGVSNSNVGPNKPPPIVGGKKRRGTKKNGKRKLSSWNLFVMKVKKANPSKSFKEVLKMAATMKKKGQMKV